MYTYVHICMMTNLFEMKELMNLERLTRCCCRAVVLAVDIETNLVYKN